MANSYRGYARPKGFQQIKLPDVSKSQREKDQLIINALKQQQRKIDQRADKSERALERKLTKEENQRAKNYEQEDALYRARINAINQNSKIVQQNAQLRSEEAEKRFQELRQFSGSLKKGLIDIKKARDESIFRESYNAAIAVGLPKDDFDKITKAQIGLHETGQKIEETADILQRKDAPPRVINHIRKSNNAREYGKLLAYSQMAGDAWKSFASNKLRDMDVTAPHEVSTALDNLQIEYLKEYGLYGISSDFLAPMLEKMGRTRNQFIHDAQVAQDFRDSQLMVVDKQNILMQTKTGIALNEYYNDLRKSFDQNGKAIGGTQAKRMLMELLSDSTIFSDEDIERMLSEPTTDQPSKTWMTRDERWYNELISMRTDNQISKINQKEQLKKAKGKKYLDDLETEEGALWAENKRFTKEQVNEYIAGWDISQFGPIPNRLLDLKTRTEESRSDDEIIAGLKEKIRKSQPIFKEDIAGIDDFDLYRQYAQIAKDSQKNSLTDEQVKQAHQRFISAIITHLDITDGYKDKEKYNINLERAKEDHYAIYRTLVPDSTNPDAHVKAMEEVVKRIKNDDYKNYTPSDADNTYAYNLNTALFAIETDSGIIKKSIIPGTETDLKRYKDSNGTIVPKIYLDLANKLPMSPTELANFQLEVAGDKPIISEIDQQTSELPPNIQHLLKLHPNPTRVQRAKIEMLKADGQISYNDVEFLVEEAIAEEIKLKGLVTPQLREMLPRMGDWKRIDKGFVKWDGTQWRQSGFFITGKKEYQGRVNEYVDIFNQKQTLSY